MKRKYSLKMQVKQLIWFFRLISATGDFVNLSGEEAAFHLHNNANITRTPKAPIKLKQLKLTKIVIPELKV